MNGENWAVFAGSSMLLALAPGPDILTVIARSVTQGTRTGLVATLGFASGLTVHTTLAAVGVAALIRASPIALAALHWFGAAYLLYLAARNAFSKNAFVLEATGTRRGLWSVYGQSALMNVLNPKVTLFFLAFLPGFVEAPGGGTRLPAWLQLIVLGAVFALCTIVVFGGCGIFAGGISRWIRQRPEAEPWLRWGTTALFVAIAIWILFPKVGN